ncbi:winged helix-turn-helix domain-containing protein [Bradyrhizobium sp. 190]|uniref:winged helix-turn-helix domain-containing tetratricopeptide repeat protein n=1 Tax=Bradyrhizobium sp. 190 TaxID=2782658 RepID=UPI001FFBBA28|nr:winged helix-turn-helix domain-containing protein [Bradyrhizobium sp. 190]MCK1512783.1 winged helix-turn-helix domain-containing protein [Bradyrhizobium sp. 190]
MGTAAGGRGRVLRFSGFELDSERAELRRPDGETVKLRPKTLEILRLLAGNAGRVLSKQQLMEAAWPNVHVGEDSLFQCIREIRTALGDDKRQVVRVISGRGYLFQAEVAGAQATEAGVTEVAAPAAPEIAPVSQPERVAPDTTAAVATNREPAKRFFDFSRRRIAFASVAGLAILCTAVAVWMLRPGLIFARGPTSIAVMPIADASNDPLVAQMAADVSGRLTDGLAKIENIRVLAPETGAPKADFVVKGELQKSEQAWTIRTRMTEAATGEVKWTASYQVNPADTDLQMQQSRLAAGVGHALALRINELLNADTRSAKSKVVIEQATAHINQTSPERFQAAQAMLEKALAEEPDNVDIQVALAALLMRGVQMVWLTSPERETAESKAEAMLQQTLRAKPNHIPAHEAYCRFLNATNQFRASLVACARALSFDPWNGIALYHVGLAQIQTGRFEDALATFKQADRFDTPQVSRWTWMIGAGWANMLMGRAEDAVPWLQKSIAITAASGRTHMLLAAAYQQLGKTDEARAAMEKGREIRPGSTVGNVPTPRKNSSPVYIEAAERIMQLMAAAGLPEG